MVGFNLKDFGDSSDYINCIDCNGYVSTLRFSPSGPQFMSSTPANRLFCIAYWLRTLGILLLVGSSPGCCHYVYPGRDRAGPIPCVPDSVPRELSKTTLADYVIEPPDVLSIEAISLIPRSPYKLRPLDVVSVVVGGVSDEANVSGNYVVQGNGTIQVIPPGDASPVSGSRVILYCFPAEAVRL